MAIVKRPMFVVHLHERGVCVGEGCVCVRCVGVCVHVVLSCERAVFGAFKGGV